VIGISPEVRLVADLNELDVDTHTVGVATHAAFQGIPDIECTANLRERFSGKRVGRGSRNHAEVRRVEAAKPRDHLVGQASAEVVLLWIAAEILERQDHEADFFWRQIPEVNPAVGAVRGEAQNRRGSRGENGPLPSPRPRPDGTVRASAIGLIPGPGTVSNQGK